MAAKTIIAVLVVLSVVCAGAASTGRHLVQAAAAVGGTAASPFDWGRPCTLLGGTTENEITGPNNAACTACGMGATATPEPTCTFKPVSVKAGDSFYISYHSSVHHLFLGDAACAFTTEVCPNATAEVVSKTTPCIVKLATPGSFFISDKAGKGGLDDGEYCKDFGAALPVTVS